MPTSRRTAVAVVVALVSLAGCSSGDPDGPGSPTAVATTTASATPSATATPTPTESPEATPGLTAEQLAIREALQAAADRTAQESSAEMSAAITIEADGEEVGWLEMGGVVRWADGIAMVIDASFEAEDMAFDFRQLMDDEHVWLHYGTFADEMPKPWVRATIDEFSDDTGTGLSSTVQQAESSAPAGHVRLLAEAPDLKGLGRHSLDGVEQTGYSGTVAIEDVAGITGAQAQLDAARAMGADEVRYVIWVDDDGLVLTVEQTIETRAMTIDTITDFYEYGVDVPLADELPEEADVMTWRDFMRWSQGPDLPV